MGGENRQYNPGQKVPNNGVYIEIGETGSMVQDPQQVELKAGEHFPECSNHNRKWSRKPKPHH
ncbi:YjzC family protein [Pseudalkalibacillus caeni]|uniref:YjzC family protein n=1 Tax=Exobacillus caeni TaxID=2574798 RepID=A0A5R9FB95_9BACL|nr:YjzC family protein [Pseudalkalibacillus caeni]TLS37824.1 YjzC family protein [Pseudalkalibacillus caeni]